MWYVAVLYTHKVLISLRLIADTAVIRLSADAYCRPRQWRRQDFVTGGSEVWVYRGSRVRSPPEADTFTGRRSPMTMKAHTYYLIFGRPPIGGSFPPFPPLAASRDLG